MKTTRKLTNTEKWAKQTDKRATNHVYFMLKNGESGNERLKVAEVLARNGKTYTCIVDLSATRNVFAVEMPSTGLSAQKDNSVIGIARSTSKESRKLLENFEKYELAGVKKESNIKRRGKSWDEYVAFIIGATYTRKDKETGAKIELPVYKKLDVSKKQDAYILGEIKARIDSWIVKSEKAKAKALAERSKTEKVAC